jgi:hypothetical protein
MYPLLLSMSLALPPTMPVVSIAPGQKGECLTVFEGDAIEPFPFVVKGVMRNFLGPRKDVVLIKLLGDKAEFTGVVAGMSGSPCSINGQLVGALSYSFAMFAKEPIAGITPIGNMLDVMQLPEESRPWRISADAEDKRDWQAMRQGSEPAPLAVASTTTGLKPIATPLAMGGVLPKVQQHFAPWLEAHGFEPMAAGTSAPGAKAKPLKPGAAVAAVLVRGDVDIAATGTVTSVDGDQVLAFGHPFFGAGAVSIPMANAEIVNTMVSTMRSFKMAVSGAVIGEVTQDRLTAIGGFLGREPAMLRVNGEVNAASGSSPFKFEVARDQALSPRFVALGLANSLTGRTDAGERGTVRVEATVQVAGQKPVVIRNVYAAERDTNLLIYPAVDIGQAFDLLWDTPFGPPPKVEVKLKADVKAEPIEEWVEAIHVDRPRVRAGESLDVAVRLRRKAGTTSLERFKVPIPYAWADGDIDITAGGVNEAEKIAQRLEGELRPDNLSDVVKWLNERRADGRLYLLVTRSGSGMRAGVDVLPFLPPSVVATMSGGPNVQRRSRGLAWEEGRERPGTVSGSANATVSVLMRE